MNLLGQPATVGRHCGSSEYEVEPRLVDFYAEALDDRQALFEHYAPPLLFHSECFKFVGEWYLKNLFGNLHGRQDWFLFAPIPARGRVRTRSTIIDRYARRGRDWVVNETDVIDAESGALLVRGHTHQSFLPPAETAGQGGFVVDAGTAKKKAPPPPFPTATGPELSPLKKTVDQRRCWMFSGPGRNYHNDREQAEKLGFPDIVVQGMMSTCFVSQLMQNHFGEGWLRGGRMSVKLTNVLWVDESVSVHGRIADEVAEGTRTRVDCQVWIDKTDGTRILAGEASALRD